MRGAIGLATVLLAACTTPQPTADVPHPWMKGATFGMTPDEVIAATGAYVPPFKDPYGTDSPIGAAMAEELRTHDAVTLLTRYRFKGAEPGLDTITFEPKYKGTCADMWGLFDATFGAPVSLKREDALFEWRSKSWRLNQHLVIETTTIFSKNTGTLSPSTCEAVLSDISDSSLASAAYTPE